jgi:hypothetical protein
MTAPRSLANLRPFQEGQSGNPSGRMKVLARGHDGRANVRESCR